MILEVLSAKMIVVGKNRFYMEGALHHLYLKAIEGFGLFYRVEDYLVFFTLFCVLVRKYGIKVEALCIMFNHIHAAIKAPSLKVFRAFCRELQSTFSRLHNDEYHNKGSMMMKSGYAPKTSSKMIRSVIIYIVNNPVEGRLVGSALEYKWNFMAYANHTHPYSDKLVKSRSRYKLRQSLAMVDRCFKIGVYLNYSILDSIMSDLEKAEKLQIVDYIVWKYNVIDYEAMGLHFGGFDNAVKAVETMVKGEYDIVEEREDYSIYRTILKEVIRQGVSGRDFGFASMDTDTLSSIIVTVSGKVSSIKHIQRFFHLLAPKSADVSVM